MADLTGHTQGENFFAALTRTDPALTCSAGSFAISWDSRLANTPANYYLVAARKVIDIDDDLVAPSHEARTSSNTIKP